MKPFKKIASLLFMLTISVSTSHADDTEIFQTHDPLNVLLIMDNSNSMSIIDNPSSGNTLTRLAKVQQALPTILQALRDEHCDTRIGLMGLMHHNADQNTINGVRQENAFIEIDDINTNYHLINNFIQGMSPTEDEDLTNGTPIIDTLYEAQLYFQGANARRGPVNQYTAPDASGNRRNVIILLTDGEQFYPLASRAINTINKIENLIGNNCIVEKINGNRNRTCGVEMADHLLYTQLVSGSPDSNIELFTVGVHLNSGDWLQRLSAAGGGTFTNTTTPEEISTAILNGLLNYEASGSVTLVQPGSSVNRLSRLTNNSSIYYSLFQPNDNPVWPGNLKKYHFNGNGEIIDANGNSAVVSGQFTSTSKSLWTIGSADGNDIEAGGALQQLPNATSRTIFTNITDTSSTENKQLVEFNPTNTTVQSFLQANIDAPSALGVGGLPTNIEDFIHWARGKNIGSKAGLRLSDPLHSKPVTVSYLNGSNQTEDKVIFYGDNAGFLHAIDDTDGEERWHLSRNHRFVI